MKISTKGRYGLKIMIDIASHEQNGAVSIKDISNRQQLSDKYSEQIVHSLASSGLLQSSRGAKGGYKLTKPASEISVKDILIATEGSLAPVNCAEDSACCENSDDCVTHFIWAEIYDATINVVSNISLAELVKRSSSDTVNCC